MCTIKGNNSTIATTGTIPHAATSCCFHLCQAISQALLWATGPIEGPLRYHLRLSFDTHHYTGNNGCRRFFFFFQKAGVVFYYYFFVTFFPLRPRNVCAIPHATKCHKKKKRTDIRANSLSSTLEGDNWTILVMGRSGEVNFSGVVSIFINVRATAEVPQFGNLSPFPQTDLA